MVRRSSFSRNWRSSKGLEGMADLCRGSVSNDSADNCTQNAVGGLPFSMAIEIENDAVPENGGGNGLNILQAEVISSVHERAHAPAFDQSLRTAWRTAIADIFLGKLVRLFLLGLRGHHQLNCKFLHMRRHQYIAADRAHLQDG